MILEVLLAAQVASATAPPQDRCARLPPSAHCHVWHKGDYMPNWYMPSVEIKWDKNYQPHVVKSPCFMFTGETVTWWDRDMLRVRDEKAPLEASDWCFVSVVHSLDGVNVQMDAQPLRLMGPILTVAVDKIDMSGMKRK